MIDQKKFTKLKAKYGVSQEDIFSNSSLLYFILTKADVDINLLNDKDWNWLQDNNFIKTYKLLEQNKKEKEQKIMFLAQENFKHIYNKYNFLFTSTPVELLGFKHQPNYEYALKSIRSSLFSILLKLDLTGDLNQAEIDYLKLNKLNAEKFSQLVDFLKLKLKYNVVEYSAVSPNDGLYSILKKIDNNIPLTDKNVRFINHPNLTPILEIYQLQQKKLEEQFTQLKEKYLATQCLETNLNSPLYKILKNIEDGNNLELNEINWLNANNLVDTVTLADFVALKFKYKATDNQDLSISSHLYKVLKKIDSDIPLPESDINFLNKRKLTETITISIEKYANYLINVISLGKKLTEEQIQWLDRNKKQNVIRLDKIKHFENLQQKYEVYHVSDNSPDSQLYLILQKLETNQRLDALEIADLQDKGIFWGKISTCYHTLEAQFYEAEYKKTSNQWNIPNISSHWRKADQPQKALQATANLNLNQIKEDKLKSAILTTRGGAFRDLEQLSQAEECAKQAIKFQPSSHHPYTLMGAICFDRYEYAEGERWFDEAVKRGAPPESIDSEIKKSIARMKDKNKRDQMIRELLKKDWIRYSWAKQYLRFKSK